MTRQSVWLTPWEWGCCGDPFSPGDTVTFTVTRGVTDPFFSLLGSDLAARIDAVETHHEERGPELISGVVHSISLVATPHRIRRVKRPERPAGTRGTMSDPSGIVAVGASRSEWMTVAESVPGDAVLSALTRVPPEHDPPEPASTDGIQNRVMGYLVEIDLPH